MTEDWSALAEEWRHGEAAAKPPALEQLRDRDRAARRLALALRTGGVALSAVLLAGGARILYWHPGIFGLLLVLPAWLLAVAIGRLLILALRGVEPRGEPTTDFIAAAARQLRLRLKSIRTLVLLVAAQAGVLLLWASARFVERGLAPPPPDAPVWLGVGLGAAVVLGWALRHHGRAHAELAEVERLHDEVSAAE